MIHYLFTVGLNLVFYLKVVTLTFFFLSVFLYTLSCLTVLTNAGYELLCVSMWVTLISFILSCLIPDGNALWNLLVKIIGE